jgi:hypothetical protein
MGNDHGSNGSANGHRAETETSPPSAAPAPLSATAEVAASAIEYYILCPQRATDVPGLITHLISRDICEKRQTENYHKCPNCVRSRMWRERNGLPVEEPAVSR